MNIHGGVEFAYLGVFDVDEVEFIIGYIVLELQVIALKKKQGNVVVVIVKNSFNYSF